MTGVERITAAFARTDKRAALMPYLMAGFPTLDESVRIGEAYIDAGADLLEVGVPYSDPLADGPVIQAAGTAALAAGSNIAGVLEVARVLAAQVPVVLMCYANMVYAPGAELFVERLARSGASGLIVPDLPLEEAQEVMEACATHGLALVLMVAPTTTPERLTPIGANTTGFLYAISVVGTTGERKTGRPDFAGIIARAKANTALPVALGFGVSTPEQAQEAVNAGADGIIVGTRLVRAASEAISKAEDPASTVADIVSELSLALSSETG